MFKKFYKIRNHYDRKRILKWVEYYPELASCKFIVQEKIHGANFAIQFKSDGSYSFQKRNSNLSMDSNFFNFQLILEDQEVISFIDRMTCFCKTQCCNWIIFGELYGDGIQKEVKYGSKRKVRFFDGYDCDTERWFAPEELIALAGESLYVPVVGYFDGLLKALDVNIEFNSLLNPIEDNICEGVVIRPFEKNYIYMHDHLVIKKKNEKFKEKVKKNIDKGNEPLDENILRYSEIACSYVTENRLSNVISHIGEPSGMKDFGNYIAEFMKDYREDVYEENPEIKDLPKKDLKIVFRSANNIAVEMLKKLIMEG